MSHGVVINIFIETESKNDFTVLPQSNDIFITSYLKAFLVGINEQDNRTNKSIDHVVNLVFSKSDTDDEIEMMWMDHNLL